MKLKFKDCPIGAKYKYPDGSVWVVLENYGQGLVASWNGFNSDERTQFCCFIDEDHTLDSEVEIVDLSHSVGKLAVELDTRKFKEDCYELIEQLQRQAFVAGFNASGEGHNGEMCAGDDDVAALDAFTRWSKSK